MTERQVGVIVIRSAGQAEGIWAPGCAVAE
jgi:hypothetical protein